MPQIMGMLLIVVCSATTACAHPQETVWEMNASGFTIGGHPNGQMVCKDGTMHTPVLSASCLPSRVVKLINTCAEGEYRTYFGDHGPLTKERAPTVVFGDAANMTFDALMSHHLMLVEYLGHPSFRQALIFDLTDFPVTVYSRPDRCGLWQN
ncbi:hypothetical protein ATO6_15445 [Oceanicola sp. 22II-s10i]|uniref:hypothetical protein n=1 Tax=Oceanicola sp. 22II-s10i TaxID=1317116 RepID=UPI000B522654|nr:hypothetical protein [Oceanicola sp. 22II-s10i]OWU83822.1 hypothetical protein ATO6_15445 [Oceanicola sp. 22II-s10i]